MAEDLIDQVYDLQMEAYELPYGEPRLHMLKEALRMAEQSRDLETIFLSKIYVADSAASAGYEEETMAILAWCLATFNENEEELREHVFDLLFLFKNFLNSVDVFPKVTRGQFDQLLGQMETMCHRFGYNQRPVHFTRLAFALGIGDRAMAQESHAKYLAIPRDDMAHCIACEANREVSYFNFLEEPEKAIKSAAKILSGAQSCGHVPSTTFNNLLRTLAILERYEEADNYQKRGYRMIRTNRTYLYQIACQIAYLIHRDRTVAAIRMFERHLAWALTTHELSNRYAFYIVAKHLFASLPTKKPTRKLSLPLSFHLYEEARDYEVAKLIGWLEEETSELAAAFDQRNGNDYFSVELPKQFIY